MIIGYAHASTEDQKLDAQITILKEAGAERIFAEKISGAKRTRPELEHFIDQLRPGDAVLVAKYDRLGRSLVDLLDIVAQIEAADAGLRSLEEGIDTTTPTPIVNCLAQSAALLGFDQRQKFARTYEM